MAAANYSDITGRVIGHWSGGGGGGSKPVDALYAGDPVAINDGSGANLTWNTLSQGTELLDRTDPANPTFLADGYYAVNVILASTAPLTAGGYMFAFINGGVGGTCVDVFHPDNNAAGSYVTQAAMGDTLTVLVFNFDGAAQRTYFLRQCELVKIA